MPFLVNLPHDTVSHAGSPSCLMCVEKIWETGAKDIYQHFYFPTRPHLCINILVWPNCKPVAKEE